MGKGRLEDIALFLEYDVCKKRLRRTPKFVLARELDRDVKRVHEDVGMLIKHGLVARKADRKIYVPYDVIHADFDLRAVA